MGLNGVSYLAISQWKVAALRPKSLAAICPWEGWTDPYRDVAYPGGVREDGFVPFWANMTEKAGRVTESFRQQQVGHPEWDDFWASRTPALERIEVPALICASFSDQGLHSRDVLAVQARFFDCFLKGEDNGMHDVLPVRLEVRTRGDLVHAVRTERAWPPHGVRWTPLYLAPGELRAAPTTAPATSEFDVPSGVRAFAFAFRRTWRSSPMKVRLHVELRGASDAHLFVAISKIGAGGREVPFEGSTGFGCDVVAKGWQRLAHRRVDESRGEPYRPYHPHDVPEPMRAGEIVPVDIEILPSATYFARGDTLRLHIQGRWF